MKSYAAVVLAAVAAATKYTGPAGKTATGVTSSKLEITVALSGTTLTADLVQQGVATAALADADKLDVIGCFLKEASKYACSLASTAYTSSSNYTSSIITYQLTATPTVASATTALTAITGGTKTTDATKAYAATAWGTTVATLTLEAAQTSAGWSVTACKASTDKKTVDFTSKWTKTSATAAMEKVVKDGMAASTYQGVALTLDGSSWASGFAALKMTAGALSYVASAGAAIAALSMAF